MAKRSSKKQRHAAPPLAASSLVRPPLLSSRGKRFLAAGALFVFAGFLLLTRTDPAGQNGASFWSPFLLVVGYLLIGIGFGVKDPAPSPHSSLSSSR
jgi:hypothetical protein